MTVENEKEMSEVLMDLIEGCKAVLAAKSACNLSGVVHDFSKHIPTIWNLASLLGKGNNWVNYHPMCRLFADCILSLTYGVISSNESMAKANRYCQDVCRGYSTITNKSVNPDYTKEP